MDLAAEMDAYDQLPEELRQWLRSSKRQLSASQVLRYLDAGHSIPLVIKSLDAAEAKLIAAANAERGQ